MRFEHLVTVPDPGPNPTGDLTPPNPVSTRPDPKRPHPTGSNSTRLNARSFGTLLARPDPVDNHANHASYLNHASLRSGAKARDCLDYSGSSIVVALRDFQEQRLKERKGKKWAQTIIKERRRAGQSESKGPKHTCNRFRFVALLRKSVFQRIVEKKKN